MRILQTSQNFYGYKNVISDDINRRNASLTFISAQLDNEGQNDLAEFKKLKNMMEMPADKIDSDVINIIYTHIDGNKPNLFLDNKVLFWGDELRWLKDNHPKVMPIEEYTRIKDIHLKAYTIMASLTKRIKDRNIQFSDEGIKNVISGFMKTMTEFTKNDNASFDILQHAFSSKVPTPRIAENLNTIISKTMEHFLM